MKISRYGWRHDKLDRRDRKFLAKKGVYAPSLDWSPGMTPCYDQLSLGSCTANGLAGEMQWLLGQENHPVIMPSRLFIYYNERAIEQSTESDSGAEIRDGIKTLNAQGFCSEDDWAYDVNAFAIQPTAICYADALKDKLIQYLSVDNTSHNDMLSALSQGPVVGGFSVFDSFESDAVATTGMVPLPGPDEEMVGGHAILVVGYDQGTGLYKCRNSWGTGWGQNGYFYVPFAYFEDGDLADDFWLCQLLSTNPVAP